MTYERGYNQDCYICQDPSYEKEGLPLCRVCVVCDAHVPADDTMCDNGHNVSSPEEALYTLATEGESLVPMSDFILEVLDNPKFYLDDENGSILDLFDPEDYKFVVEELEGILANHPRHLAKVKKQYLLYDYLTRPYTFPGSYTKTLILADGEALCRECVDDNIEILKANIIELEDKQWCPEGVVIHWEGYLECSHCYKEIEPEYGDD